MLITFSYFLCKIWVDQRCLFFQFVILSNTFCLKMISSVDLFPVLFWQSSLPLCSCHIDFLSLSFGITMCVPPVSPCLPLVYSSRVSLPSCPRLSALILVSVQASFVFWRTSVLWILGIKCTAWCCYIPSFCFLPFWIDLSYLPPQASTVSEHHKNFISFVLYLTETKFIFKCFNWNAMQWMWSSVTDH